MARNRQKREYGLDLRGEVCPYTFVKAKIKLEDLASGDTLRMVVDYKPAATSVPRSFRRDGHSVLGVEQVGDGVWEIVVRKEHD